MSMSIRRAASVMTTIVLSEEYNCGSEEAQQGQKKIENCEKEVVDDR